MHSSDLPTNSHSAPVGATALDLFAGAGGWSLACQRLGITEYGVEIMPEAVATRDAAGFLTAYGDVWDGLARPQLVPAHNLLIASPPCQTFSVAGKGAGRQALDEVLELIADRAYALPGDGLRRATEERGFDDRTALVLTPLAYAYRYRPTYIALEQVPTVLPVWQAFASELEGLGYSVATANLNSEQYGVPQTRKRAILVASLDPERPAALPAPTHSKYHPRTPDKLDPEVRPWVSMAEALGASVGMELGSSRLRSNYSAGGNLGARGERELAQPGSTITSKAGSMKFVGEPWGRTDISSPTVAGDTRLPKRAYGKGSERQMDGALRLTQEGAAVLQSFPADFPFQGTKTKRFLQLGNAVPPLLAEAIISQLIPARATVQAPVIERLAA